MIRRHITGGTHSGQRKQKRNLPIPQGVLWILRLLILLCTLLFLVSAATAASPVVKIPVSFRDDSGLISARPAVQPAIVPSLPGGATPGVSSRIISPVVREPVRGTERCTICGTDDTNQSVAGSEPARIAQGEEAKKIAEIQANISREDRDWVAGHTSVSNLTSEAFNRLLGAEPPEEMFELNNTPALPTFPAASLPSSFTWQSNGGDYTTPIRNQGQCGSCWAFAATGVFETFWERLNQNPALNPDFAEQYLVSCSYENGCGGGWNPLSLFINQAGKSGGVGTVVETDYPYTASDSSCKNLNGYTRYKAPAGTAWYMVSGWSIPTNDQIKSAVSTYGPLFVTLGVDGTFSAYRSGIYSSSYSGGINHAVVLVGWGTAADGRTYWICKNSWGTWWGEAGWFRIYAGSNYIGYAAAYMTNPYLPAPTISAITPASAKTGSLVPITNLAGSNFISGARVNLTRTGSANVTAMNVQVPTLSQITGSFNLAGVTSGVWNVIVVNPDGKIGSLANGFTVLPNLTARFYGVPGTTVSPYTVKFYDVSEGNPISWSWNFGDGVTNTTRNPSHTYSPGTYSVSLTISDGVSSSSTGG
ncbi:MAG: C1 family peptidase [Methanobacteriota archaeon]